MKQKVQEKGISLIVLVITIIIIIILAGAVILSLNNSNIISKAKLARESNDFVGIREMVEMEKSNESLTGTFDKTKITIPSNYSSDIEITAEGTVLLKYNANTNITDIPNAVDKLGAVYIPNGFVASSVVGEMSKENGLVIYEGTVSNPDQTAVNQFVWVPVENYGGFVREHFGTTAQKWWTGNFYVASYATKTDNMLEVEPIANYAGTDATQLEVNAMYDSVKKYKGFYIARYEAADNGSGKAISQKDKTAWVTIVWGDAGADSNGLYGIPNATGAVGKSRAMYSSSTSVQSTLVYGVQWDAIIRWYKASGINVENSTGHGNYNAGDVVPTGYYKDKNIYDIAGNAMEWTMEAYGTDVRVMRGGSFSFDGAVGPASNRDYYYPDYNDDTGLSFRPALYIK